jgi:outer membrane protein OmpA-like peptidoglycan-associated protein
LISVGFLVASCCGMKDSECCKPETAAVVAPETVEAPASAVETVATPAEPVKTAAPIELKPVNFANGSTALSEEAQATLDANAAILLENKSVAVDVQGLASSTGPQTLNQKLAAKRSEAAKNYLIKKGIESNRITIGDAKVGNTRAAVFSVRNL